MMKRSKQQNLSKSALFLDLLLSVYELTARTSLQLAKPRHQSQGRHFPNQQDKEIEELQTITSPKKTSQDAVSPQGSLQKITHHNSSLAAVRRNNKQPQLVMRQQYNMFSPRTIPHNSSNQGETLQQALQQQDSATQLHNKNVISVIRSYMKSATDIVEGTSDNHEKLIRAYRVSRQNMEVLAQRLESNEMQVNIDNMQNAISGQLEKFKVENENLKKRISDINSQDLTTKSALNGSYTSSQVQNLQLQIQSLETLLQKMEKKAESRKICIKKLYQLLEKNERELELYRTGKKATKNSFINQQLDFGKTQTLVNKKNELNEILNTVYQKKPKQDSQIETLLMSLIQNVDPKSYDLLKPKQQNTNSSISYDNSQIDENKNDQEKLQLIQNSIKFIKQEVQTKKENEQIVQSSFQYSLRLIEANQQILKQIIAKQPVDTITYEPLYQFMIKNGCTKMSEELNKLEIVQSKISNSIKKYLEDMEQLRSNNENSNSNKQNILAITNKINEIIQKYQIHPTHKDDNLKQLDEISSYISSCLDENENCVKVKNDCQRLEGKLKDVLNQKGDLEQKITQVNKEREKLINEHKESQEALKESFNSLKQTYEQNLVQIQEQLQQNERKQNQEVLDLKSGHQQSVLQAQQLEQKLEIQNGIILKYEEKYISLNKRNQEYLHVIEKREEDKLKANAECMKLQEQVSYLKGQVQELQNKIIQQQDKVNQSSKLKDKANREAEMLQNQIKNIQNQQQKDLQRFDEVNQQLFKSTNKNMITQINLLTDKIDNLQYLYLKAQLLVKELEQRKQNYKESSECLDLQLHELQGSLLDERKINQQQQQTILNLEGLNEGIQSQIRTLEKNQLEKHQECVQLLEDLNQVAIQLTRKRQKYQQKTQDTLNEIQLLNNQIGDLKLAYSQGKEENANMRAQNQTLKDQIKLLNSQIEKQQLDYDLIVEQNDNQRCKISDYQIEASSLENQIIQLKQISTQEADSSRLLLQRADNNIKTLTQQIDEKHNQCELHSKEIQAQAIQLIDLNSQVQIFQDQVDQLQTKYNQIQTENNHSKKQCKELVDVNLNLENLNQDFLTQTLSLNKTIEDLTTENKQIRVDALQHTELLNLQLSQKDSDINKLMKETEDKLHQISEEFSVQQAKQQETIEQQERLSNEKQLIIDQQNYQIDQDLLKISQLQEQFISLSEQKVKLEREYQSTNVLLNTTQLQYTDLKIQNQDNTLHICEIESQLLAMRQLLQENSTRFNESINQLSQDYEIKIKQQGEETQMQIDQLQKSTSELIQKIQDQHAEEISLVSQQLDSLSFMILQQSNIIQDLYAKQVDAKETQNAQLVTQSSMKQQTDELYELNHYIQSRNEEDREYPRCFSTSFTSIEKDLKACNQALVEMPQESGLWILLDQQLNKEIEICLATFLLYKESLKKTTEQSSLYKQCFLTKQMALDKEQSLNKVLEDQSLQMQSTLEENEQKTMLMVHQMRILEESNQQLQNQLNFKESESRVLIEQVQDMSQQEQLSRKILDEVNLKINNTGPLSQQVFNLKNQLDDMLKQISEQLLTIEQLNKIIQEQKPINYFSQQLENLFQELLYNRVNLTSVKQTLTEEQRDKLFDYRKKVGEIQGKLIQIEKIQKSFEDCKFNLQQYQQIIDKSEMRARYFENECQKKEDQIREIKQLQEQKKIQKRSITPQEFTQNSLVSNVEQEADEFQPQDKFLNFTLTENILYGDKSFFEGVSMIEVVSGLEQQNIYQMEEQLKMAEEDINELRRQLRAKQQ